MKKNKKAFYVIASLLSFGSYTTIGMDGNRPQPIQHYEYLSSSTTILKKIPKNITLHHIYSHLTPQEQIKFAQVCKYFFSIYRLDPVVRIRALSENALFNLPKRIPQILERHYERLNLYKENYPQVLPDLKCIKSVEFKLPELTRSHEFKSKESSIFTKITFLYPNLREFIFSEFNGFNFSNGFIYREKLISECFMNLPKTLQVLKIHHAHHGWIFSDHEGLLAHIFSKFPNLRELSLPRGNFLRNFKEKLNNTEYWEKYSPTSIEHLEWEHFEPTDQELKTIFYLCPKLKTLSLNNKHLENITAKDTFSQLTSLALSLISNDKRVISSFFTSANLHTLNITKGQIPDSESVWNQISQSLKILKLSKNTYYTNYKSLGKILSKCSQLEEFSFSILDNHYTSSITDLKTGLPKCFKKLPNTLKKLRILDKSYGKEGSLIETCLKTLSEKIPTLTSLKLDSITSNEIYSLLPIELKTLSLMLCANSKNPEIIKTRCPSLMTFKITGKHTLRYDMLPESLTYLSTYDAKITSSELTQLFQGCPSLRKLKLEGQHNETLTWEDIIKEIPKNMVSLSLINMSQVKITYANLLKIPEHLRKLSVDTNWTFKDKINKEHAQLIRGKFPNTIIHILTVQGGLYSQL